MSSDIIALVDCLLAFLLESRSANELDTTGVLNVLEKIGLNREATDGGDVKQYYRTLATKIMMGNDIFGLKLIEKVKNNKYVMTKS